MESDGYTKSLMENAYQEANQTGQGQDPNSLYADYMREEKVRNVIEQINPDYLLEDIEHRIRGELKDRFTKDWKQIGKPKVSELLITNYISFLGSILNQNTSLSNFSAKEINNIMEMIVDYTTDDLSDNDESYGFVKKNVLIINQQVKKLVPYTTSEGFIIYTELPMIVEHEMEISRVVDYNEMTRIGNIICMTTFAVLKRAMNGMEAQRIFKHLNMSENLNQQQQKKGAMDFLKFWQ